MFNTVPLVSAGLDDIFVAKYDGDGNVLWAKSAGGTDFDQGGAIDIDADGNSYVTGAYSGTANFGSFSLTSPNSFDIFVAKFDTSGTVLWAQSAGGAMEEVGAGIGVDATENSYLIGHFQGTVTFGSLMVTSAGSDDIFVAKYAACGNGIVKSSEECDDGNTDDGDGCSATCTVEPGSKCTGEPSVCITGIPTVSEWGLVVMALLVLTAGTLVYMRRHPAAE